MSLDRPGAANSSATLWSDEKRRGAAADQVAAAPPCRRAPRRALAVAPFSARILLDDIRAAQGPIPSNPWIDPRHPGAGTCFRNATSKNAFTPGAASTCGAARARLRFLPPLRVLCVPSTCPQERRTTVISDQERLTPVHAFRGARHGGCTRCANLRPQV